ncbi:guanylate-binding protein 1-like [Heptranchias perlo]|uniref:guanylate-binding protein 1-like n=1 Tax=Heptranchias perlo TaxID=212740 RepID=UPI003559C6DD
MKAETVMKELVMEEPMILFENSKGKLRLNPAALDILRAIEVPVVVVAVAGAARTGKSYLLNRLAGANKGQRGFSLGSTVQSHTKGIWMWCLPHPRRPEQGIILLDTEGLGDPEKGDEQNDNSIFALAILLSSLFVYNSKGPINQQSMRDLHFVAELAQRIQVKSQTDVGAEREFVLFFPDFVWTLQDLTVDLELNGLAVSADEYLEYCLRLRNGGEQDRDYNRLRSCIRDYFPSRRCFAFVCPASRKDLSRIQELRDEQLDPESVEEFHKFLEYVHTSGKVKKVLGGHQVTGRRLGLLAEAYLEAIAVGDLPCVEIGIARMAELENTAAVKEALDNYDQNVAKISQLPSHIVYSRTDLFTSYHNEAVETFMRHSLKYDNGKHIRILEESLHSRYDSLIAKIESESRNRCEEILLRVMATLVQNLESGHYLHPGGYQKLTAALVNGRRKFEEGSINEVMAAEVLGSFLRVVKPRLEQVLQVGASLHQKDQQISALKDELLELEREKELREKERAVEERSRIAALVGQLEVQFEKENSMKLAELNSGMERKKEEEAMYSSEGRGKEQKKARDDYEHFERAHESFRSRSFSDYLYSLCGWLVEKFVWILS